MQAVEPFHAKNKISPQLKLENLINNSLIFNSNKEGLSFKNSFFSNMMSIRGDDSMGIMGFGDLNLSRRETSNRKDSYQMNKLGQNRQSFDLFSIKKQLHTIGSERELIGELKKQISVGEFGKNEMIRSREMGKEGLGSGECVNIYNKGVKEDLFEKKKYDGKIEQIEPRKTYRNKGSKMDFNNIFEEMKEEKERTKHMSPLKNEMVLKNSSDRLREITKKQKQVVVPKLKDKLRHSKKSKKKVKKLAQFDNKEIRKGMKKFELVTNGKKIVYEGKPKASNPKLNNPEKQTSQISKKALFKKSFKKRGSYRNTGKGGKRNIKGSVINVEDEREFNEKLQSEMLSKPQLRESLKHIIEQGRENNNNNSKSPNNRYPPN
jgi:hypothetical protein